MERKELNDNRTPANAIQIGGDHYKRTGGEEHWDRVWRLYGRGYFVGCITKYVERYQLKNGMRDLEKAQHFLQKLMELEQRDQGNHQTQEEWNRGNGLMGRVTLPPGPPLPDNPGDDGVASWNTVVSIDATGFAPTNYESMVKPTGWLGFTFEGANADTMMYRCTKCKVRFEAHPADNPHHVHKCPDAAEAGPGYVNQG